MSIFHAAQPITFAAGIIPADSRSSAIEQASSASRVALSTAETMGNVFQRHSEIQEPQVPSPDNESVSCTFDTTSFFLSMLTDSQLITLHLLQRLIQQSQTET
jgi:hypothetical protein